MRLLTISAAVVAAGALAGCTYEQNRPVAQHFQDFKTIPPTATAVTVCHAYGCRMQTKVRMKPKDMAELKKIFAQYGNAKNKKSPEHNERVATAYAIGWLERRIGEEIGTSADRAGMEYNGPGDPTQQDCVDEATNTTAYLLLLEQNGFFKHHKVGTPFAKEALWRGVAGWPHWTAVLKENKTGQRWAVDSWIYENGENPAVVEAEKWYIEDLNNLPKPTT